MKKLTIALALCLAATAAQAQVQPGPNLLSGGRMFTYSPRASYMGPPVPVYPYPPRGYYPGFYGPPLPPPEVVYIQPDPLPAIIGGIIGGALSRGRW